MSDLVWNPQDQFPHVRAHFGIKIQTSTLLVMHLNQALNSVTSFEPPRGKTNNVVSEQV